MLKTIIFLFIAVALSAFAALQFAAQLETVSATRAKRDPDHPRKQFEVGKLGRVAITVVFAVVMILLGLLSRFYIVSTIIALALAVVMVLANTYLRQYRFRLMTCFFILWMGNLISSIKEAHITTSTTGWGKIYVVLQVIALILLVVGTVVGNIRAFTGKVRSKDEKDAEKAEDESDTETDEADDEDDESDDEFEKDPFNEELLNKVIKIGGIVLIIVLCFVIGYWLETSFDFFPPYRF